MKLYKRIIIFFLASLIFLTTSLRFNIVKTKAFLPLAVAGGAVLTSEGAAALLTLLALAGFAISDPFDTNADFFKNFDLSEKQVEHLNKLGTSSSNGYLNVTKEDFETLGLFDILSAVNGSYKEKKNLPLSSLSCSFYTTAGDTFDFSSDENRFFSIFVVGHYTSSGPRYIILSDSGDSVFTLNSHVKGFSPNSIEHTCTALSGYPGIYSYSGSLHYQKKTDNFFGFDLVVDGEEFNDLNYCYAYAYNTFGLGRFFDIGGEELTVEEDTLADYWVQGLDVPYDKTWDYVVDVVLGGNSTVTDEKTGVAVPVVGVAVPEVVVDVTDDKVTVIPPVAGTVAKPLTETDVTTGETDTLDPDISADTTTEIGIMQGVWNWIINFFKNLYNTLLQALRWFGNFLIGSGTLDFSRFQVEGSKLLSVFPFCIPFDLYNCFVNISGKSAVPVINFDFSDTVLGRSSAQPFVISVDLGDERFIVIIKIFRYFLLLSFIVGLARVTRALIRG